MQNHTHTQITVIIDTSEQGYNATISWWRDMQNHTHTDYNHHWYIRTRLQCGHIFMMRYAKSHTHTSILLAGRRSSCTWSSNKLHFCWRLRDLIPGMTKESFYLAMRTQSILNLYFWFARAFRDWREKAWKNNDHWTQDEGLFILKTMIIGRGMKLFILMPGGYGLPSPDTATRKEYVTRVFLAAMLEGWGTQPPLSQELF
jgi:hypothetical protein